MKLFALPVIALIALSTAAFAQPAPPPNSSKLPPAKVEQAPSVPVIPTADDAKALKQEFDLWQLDALAVDTEQSKFAQTDPVAKRAKQIWDDAMKSSPEVSKAVATAEADRKALMDKIVQMRKNAHLDDNWEWDFNGGKFYQKSAPVAAPVTQPVQTPAPSTPSKGAPTAPPGKPAKG